MIQLQEEMSRVQATVMIQSSDNNVLPLMPIQKVEDLIALEQEICSNAECGQQFDNFLQVHLNTNRSNVGKLMSSIASTRVWANFVAKTTITNKSSFQDVCATIFRKTRKAAQEHFHLNDKDFQAKLSKYIRSYCQPKTLWT